MSSAEVVKLQDPKSLLVITIQGQLRHLFLPIRAQCIGQVEHIPTGAYVYIEAAFSHKTHRLIYWIGGRLYPYHYFLINLQY